MSLRVLNLKTDSIKLKYKPVYFAHAETFMWRPLLPSNLPLVPHQHASIHQSRTSGCLPEVPTTIYNSHKAVLHAMQLELKTLYFF